MMGTRGQDQVLYELRFKGGIAGIVRKLIWASDDQMAELVGQTWCNREPNRRFIGVERAVVADESILDALSKDEFAAVILKSTTGGAPEAPAAKIPVTR